MIETNIYIETYYYVVVACFSFFLCFRRFPRSNLMGYLAMILVISMNPTVYILPTSTLGGGELARVDTTSLHHLMRKQLGSEQ